MLSRFAPISALLTLLAALNATTGRADTITASPMSRVSGHGNVTSGRIEPPYDAGDHYMTAGGLDGFVFVNPDVLNSLFMAALKTAFPESAGWTFAISPSSVPAADLLLHTYDAEHGRDDDGPCATCVGAEFDLEYRPAGTDPTANIHWIQIVADNHAVNGNHGTLENVVDNGRSPGHRSPYYDDGFAADSRNFYDFPVRLDDDMNHWWTANLLLVTGPAANAGPGKITIYNDVVWGWGNTVPEPSAGALVLLGLVGLVCRHRLTKVFRKSSARR